MFATAFIGVAYSVGQTVFTIIHMARGNEVGYVVFDFYAEEVSNKPIFFNFVFFFDPLS